MESGSHQKLWRDSLKKYFGASSVVRKTARLHDDITCLSRGLKRSLLLDYLRPDPIALQRFLQSLSHHDSDLFHMTILVVNGDVFLMHKPYTLDRTIQIVDVSNNSAHISLLSEDISVKIKHQMRDWLDTAVPSLSTSGICVVSMLQPCPVNLCSLYGWLVGYPSVYWFEESSGHSLDCVELTLWTVLARNESHMQQQQPLWQNVSLRDQEQLLLSIFMFVYCCFLFFRSTFSIHSLLQHHWTLS